MDVGKTSTDDVQGGTILEFDTLVDKFYTGLSMNAATVLQCIAMIGIWLHWHHPNHPGQTIALAQYQSRVNAMI